MPRAIVLTIIVFAAIVIFSVFIIPKKKKNNVTAIKDTKNLKPKSAAVVSNNKGGNYAEKLEKTKEFYPFVKWRTNFTAYDMEQYTEENCNSAKHIFDTLIADLITVGERSEEKNKVALFETAITALNNLDSKAEGLIETGEREDLCELIDYITIAAGLNPDDYADGEGLADLWRDW